MKKLNLLIVFIFSLFLFGCESFEPELSHIEINEHNHCTYILEESDVLLYSFFKIKVIPEPGYYFDHFWGSGVGQLNFYKSTDEENTYYILAMKKELTIDIELESYPKHYINKDSEATNFTLSLSKYNTFAGDTVTFTITPDESFYLDSDTVEVRKKLNNYTDYDYEKLDFKQSKTNPNDFSFIMPNKEVAIFAKMNFAITEVSPHKSSFTQGETIIFDITNHNPEDEFDIQISDCYSKTKKSDYKTIEEGIKLSGTYILPFSVITDNYYENDTGRYTLHIYPNKSNYYTKTEATTDFVINLADMPDGWTTIGVKNDIYSIGKISGSAEFYLSNIDIPNGKNLHFNYTLENNDRSNTFEESFYTTFYNYNNSCNISRSLISLEYTELKPYTKMIVWIEDDELKYISRKVTLNLSY